MRQVALDFMDRDRRTYDFARPLYRREAPIGRLERARLITAAGADELMLTLFRQVRTPDDLDIATTLVEARTLVGYLDHAGALTDPTIYHEAPRVPDLEWRSRAIAGRRFEHRHVPEPVTRRVHPFPVPRDGFVPDVLRRHVRPVSTARTLYGLTVMSSCIPSA